jgi:alpha-glucosidase
VPSRDPGDNCWWRQGVIYQIYPRSFQDANRDGIGDLEGIRRRLDHLVSLKIDAIWISPIYASPMADFGYDVSDHRAIDPIFGTMKDFDRLLDEAHRKGLKVILDYVPNHTSDQHPWFVESRASRRNPKRDWYVWRDARADGGPPNNWTSEFGGPAWTFDETTGQFYFHAYLTQQPDLNWRNPEVVAAMLEVLRFWFDRGVDGFRVDAIHHLFEDAQLRDDPVDPDWREGLPPSRRLLRSYSMDQPEVHGAIALMRGVAKSYADERLLIGEAYLPIERLMAYYGMALSGFHLPFNFHLISTPWKPKAIAALIDEYETALPQGGWPNWVLGNHDRSRVATRLGPEQARVAAMLLLTLRGTPTLYQGDEVGMADVPIPPHLLRDPLGKNEPGFGRDPERTPMQWDASPHAGFSSVEPWLPVARDFTTRNVENQSSDSGSMLSLHRALIALRREEAALAIGSYALVQASEHMLAYERCHGERRLIVALNFGDRFEELESLSPPARLLLSTDPAREKEAFACAPRLNPHEGIVAELTPLSRTDR